MKKEFHATISGLKCQTLRGFYTQIANALHFPDYFGKNLDALEECLLDLSWLAEKEVSLTISNRSYFLENETDENREFVAEIFEAAVEKEGEKQFSLHWKD